MKKTVLILAMLLMSLVAHALETVGNYQNSYFGKKYSIEASQKNGKINDVYIEIDAKNSKTAYLLVEGKDLEIFKTALELVRDKYIDWVKIAKDNNVTEMEKEFDIKFPSVSIAWYGSKWWFSFGKKMKMRFSILDSGKMVAVWAPKVTASTNEYIDERIYFVFDGIEDFNNLISQLNYQSILEQLLKTKNNEDLFQ